MNRDMPFCPLSLLILLSSEPDPTRSHDLLLRIPGVASDPEDECPKNL
jgi:hypothetical protein